MDDNALRHLATDFLQRHIDEPFELSTASGGLVHHVYKVSTKDTAYFLKVRGTRFVKMPSITCDPEDIEYEFRALKYFYKAMPASFPRIIAYDRNQAMLLMTSVMTPDINLEHLLNTHGIGLQHIRLIATRIAHIHKRLKSVTSLIRDSKENEYYNSNLYYRLESLNRPALKQAVNMLRKQEKQIIFGDLSPKNMAVDDQGVYMCDLDTAHYGNVLFDLSFLAAHVLLHTFKHHGNTMTVECITAYLKQNGLGMDPEKQDLLMRTLLGVCLYRLDNTIVPYNLPDLSQFEKNILIARIDKLLSKAGLALTDITRLRV